MLIETKETFPINEPIPDSILDYVSDPLSAWVNASNQLRDTNNLYKGPNGKVDQLSRKITDACLDASSKVIQNVQSRVRMMRKNIQSGTKVRGIDTSSTLDKKMFGATRANIINLLARPFPPTSDYIHYTYADKRAFQLPKEFVAETITETVELITTYKSETKNRSQQKRESGGVVAERLNSWLSGDFSNLWELVAVAESDSDESRNIFRFIADDNRIKINESISTARRNEVENPSDETLLEFFDQLGSSFYHDDKKADQFWPLIEFQLPFSSEQIRAFYQDDQDPEIRREFLFGPIIEQFKKLDKKLPPQMKERLASHLVRIQDEQLNLLRAEISKHKVVEKAVYIPREKPEELISTNGQHPETRVPHTKIETEKTRKNVVISGVTYEDETDLNQGLSGFLQSELKSVRLDHLDRLGQVVAKIAGQRKDAPRFDMVKVVQLEAEFDDGNKEPVHRVRLTYRNAPRLFISFYNGQVFVVSAIYRESKSYDEIARRGGFGLIQLPNKPS